MTPLEPRRGAQRHPRQRPVPAGSPSPSDGGDWPGIFCVNADDVVARDYGHAAYHPRWASFREYRSGVQRRRVAPCAEHAPPRRHTRCPAPLAATPSAVMPVCGIQSGPCRQRRPRLLRWAWPAFTCPRCGSLSHRARHAHVRPTSPCTKPRRLITSDGGTSGWPCPGPQRPVNRIFARATAKF